MPTARMAAVVEGHGDAQAVPILIRRIAEQSDPALAVIIPAVIRTPKSKLAKPNELERAVELAARKLGGQGAVLILVDADDDCPGVLGPELLNRARRQRGELPIGTVVAKNRHRSRSLARASCILHFVPPGQAGT